MKIRLPDHFTRSHLIAADGTLAFTCATEPEHWPWLALPPSDPIVVQALNYYAAYEVAIARGLYQKGQWTALTQTAWTCTEHGAGHAARGVAEPPADDGSADYRMSFYDRDNTPVYRMSGKGVIFKNRNFAAWRKEQQQGLQAVCDASDFPYVPAEAVGMATQIESYLSNLSDEDGKSATGLITLDNGFLPRHPYNSGSGDHVNATHLADASRQFVRLLHRAPNQAITAGEMQFRRFVELGHPFRISLTEDDPARNTVALAVHQADRLCANILLRYAGGP